MVHIWEAAFTLPYRASSQVTGTAFAGQVAILLTFVLVTVHDLLVN